MEKKLKRVDVYTLTLSSLLISMSIILTRVFSIMVPLGGLPALRIGFGSIPIIIGGIILGPSAGAVIGLVADLLGFLLNPMGGVYFPGFTFSSVMMGFIPGILIYKVKIQNSKINFNIVNAITILLFSIGVFRIMVKKEALSIIEGNMYFYEQSISWFIPLAIILVILAFIVIPFYFGKSYKKGNNRGLDYDVIYFVVSMTFIICNLLINTWSLSILLDKGFMIFLPGRVLSGLFTIPLYTFIIFVLFRSFKFFKINDEG